MRTVDNIGEVHQIMLGIGKHIHDFCVQNNIKYFLSCGTLIGAVRHQGFIPWDDDMDLMMLREDYDKFCRLYSHERYKFINCYISDAYEYPFGRVYDDKTCCFHGNVKREGASVDIYIIDRVPDDSNLLRKHMKRLQRFAKMQRFLIKVRGGFRRLHIAFTSNDDFVFLSRCCKKQDSFASSYRDVQTDHVLCNSGSIAYRTPLNRSWFDGAILTKFEDTEFYIPSGYDCYLSATYGDYMKLPPVEKQNPHHGQHFYIE